MGTAGNCRGPSHSNPDAVFSEGVCSGPLPHFGGAVGKHLLHPDGNKHKIYARHAQECEQTAVCSARRTLCEQNSHGLTCRVTSTATTNYHSSHSSSPRCQGRQYIESQQHRKEFNWRYLGDARHSIWISESWGIFCRRVQSRYFS